MAKNIIVTNTSQDEDEHTYYGIVFIQPDITMKERLRFKSSSGLLEAKFTFWSQNPLIVDEKFLVVLVGVDESEEINLTESRIVAKIAADNQTINFTLH
jgi:hypothetical protein